MQWVNPPTQSFTTQDTNYKHTKTESKGILQSTPTTRAHSLHVLVTLYNGPHSWCVRALLCPSTSPPGTLGSPSQMVFSWLILWCVLFVTLYLGFFAWGWPGLHVPVHVLFCRNSPFLVGLAHGIGFWTRLLLTKLGIWFVPRGPLHEVNLRTDDWKVVVLLPTHFLVGPVFLSTPQGVWVGP